MYSGPNIERDGLVLALDGASRRSTLKATQVNNILPDPGNWTVGTGGQTGYSPNGSSSEQNRVYVSDDPWGRLSVTWRTTPDSTSGADGGWNSSYYSIDTSFTYRYSVWVRRYTTGTGGTFYLGMNPAPIRNDNNAVQSNPYFTYPSIASLTHNQWYLVVGHVFNQGYIGGRHPESGWYTNGSKISDPSFGNIGGSDARWNPGTTSAMHRAYHYYTTNTASGIEFAYPRIDKIDGKEPSISEMINKGESGWSDLIYKNIKANTYNGINYIYNGKESSFTFDGTNDYIDLGSDITYKTSGGWTVESVVYYNSVAGGYNNITSPANFIGADGITYNSWYWSVLSNKLALWNISPGTWRYGSTTLQPNTWYHTALVSYDSGTSYQMYLNGVAEGGDHTTYTWNASYSGLKVRYIGRGNSGNTRLVNGQIPVTKIYNRALSAQEIQQNYQAYKNRFNLS